MRKFWRRQLSLDCSLIHTTIDFKFLSIKTIFFLKKKEANVKMVSSMEKEKNQKK